MATCNNCGGNLPDGASFCTICGTPLAPAFTEGPAQPVYEQTQQTYNSVPPAQPYVPNTAYNPVPEGFDAQDIAEHKAISIFCYITPFIFIPLIAAKDSKYAKVHINHGISLIVFELILALCCFIPVLGWLACSIGYLVSLVLRIIGIVHASKGNVEPLAIVGKYKFLY